jgi:ubiquinone/menaquinone biosynthesis C-methylase UbiE
MPLSRESFWRDVFDASAIQERSDSAAALWSDYGLSRRFEQFKRILSSLDVSPHRSLDAGCGPGIYSIHLAQRYPQIIALDASVNMIHRMKRNVMRVFGTESPMVTSVAGEVSKLPLRRESIDLLVCFGVLQYVEDESQALLEFFRVLKPGGFCIINVPSSRFILVRRNDMMKRLHPRRFELLCDRVGFSSLSIHPLILLPSGLRALERLDRAVSSPFLLQLLAHDFTIVLRRPI